MNLLRNDLSDLPVFFIVGRGRCGSTLLRSCFDAHPNVTIPPESRFVQYLYYRYHQIKKWTPELALRAISDINKSFEPLLLDHRRVFELVKKYHNNLSFPAVCKIIYLSASTAAGDKGIHCIGDKNPRYTFYIRQLKNIFPDARFIHLVRDYRANALAVTRAAKNIGETKSVPIALSRWKYYNRTIDKIKRSCPHRFYTLRYEDLVKEPDNTLRKLCEFVGVKFSAAMLNYDTRLKNYYHDPAFSKLHQSLKTPFDKAKISEWQEKLSRHDIKVCEILAGNYGQRFGYQTTRKVTFAMKALYRIIYAPLIRTGKIRFMLKNIFYNCPVFMRLFYNFIQRKK
ncbi:MAG: sulfotransferase [Bacteroidales bacterium]|nr:sulfotransferase [Bacteroidales bacterium]